MSYFDIIDKEASPANPTAWKRALKSIEEFRSQEAGDISDQVAGSVAGQNILGDLRLSELLDKAAKLLDRAARQPSAIVEESAHLVQELQKVANGQSSWAPPAKRQAL